MSTISLSIEEAVLVETALVITASKLAGNSKQVLQRVADRIVKAYTEELQEQEAHLIKPLTK